MANKIRVCIFNQQPEAEPALRSAFEQTEMFELIGVYEHWEEIRDWVRQGVADMAAFYMDGAEELALEGIEFLGRMTPHCGILGISSNTNPQAIIKAMRAGCQQFVCWPIDPNDLSEAVDRIQSSQSLVLASSKRICVIGSSGGAGTTTIACNLAIELGNLSERKAALVDMNLEFGDVSCAFDSKPKYSVADTCRDGVEIDRVLIAQAMTDLPCKVAVLGRPERIEAARDVTPEGVDRLMRVLSEVYPFVVVDLPRAYSFLSAAALHHVDRVLIVTQLGVPFIRNATRIYECLLQMDTPEKKIEIVLNRCQASFERISPADVEAHFGKPIFAAIPNDYRRVQSALDFGHPIVADAPSSPARLAIQEMARAIAGDMVNDQSVVAQAGPGIFGRIWNRGRTPKAIV